MQEVSSQPSIANVSAVELRRVGRSFGSTVALRGVTGRFEPGHAHLIVGANGSGKSTLLRILSTMLRPTFGEVVFEGASFSTVRSTLGWVSHDALVYPDLTGLDNLGLAAGLCGLSQCSVHDALSRFRIGGYACRPVRSMSRGQRQRIALARALLHQPSLLLLDEPSTGLDSDGVNILRSVVREEVLLGRLVLVVTHAPHHFSHIPLRVWRMHRGRISLPTLQLEANDVPRETSDIAGQISPS